VSDGASAGDGGGALTLEQQQALLELARGAAARAARGESDAGAGAAPAGLDRPGAAFVTLRVGGELRGCIGTFEGREPLWDTVHDMAVAAATRDPRFPRLGTGDLDALGVDISVLAPARRVSDPAEIEVGRHGLEIRRGLRRGLLLPQVATDHGLDRETFLAETCRKAGLSPKAWREPDTEIWSFEAQVFGDAPS
jgi:AmmeMemoRadiSam system protein A